MKALQLLMTKKFFFFFEKNENIFFVKFQNKNYLIFFPKILQTKKNCNGFFSVETR